MISNKIKKMSEKNNKTRKRKDKTSTSLYLTPEQQAIVCKKSANTYNTFEDKIEELFKKNNIDVVSTSFNLEKQIVSELKKAVNPKGIKPNEDFYLDAFFAFQLYLRIFNRQDSHIIKNETDRIMKMTQWAVRNSVLESLGI